MTIVYKGLKVKVKDVCQTNAVSLTSIKGSFSSVDVRVPVNISISCTCVPVLKFMPCLLFKEHVLIKQMLP